MLEPNLGLVFYTIQIVNSTVYLSDAGVNADVVETNGSVLVLEDISTLTADRIETTSSLVIVRNGSQVTVPD